VLVPIYGFVRGDTIGLVALVHDHQTVADLAATLQQAAAVRVAPKPRAKVYFERRLLDPKLTIAAAGIGVLDRVDVIGEDE
jgi:hypothetical protein